MHTFKAYTTFDNRQTTMEEDNMNKKNSYAVITGASSGIGEEFVKRLAREGYKIILVARREDRLNEIKAQLDAAEAESQIILADLGQISECRRLVEEISDKKIGVFINNAGFGDCGRFDETDIDKELSMIDVNVKAVHYLTKSMVKKMEKQHGGYILNVASSAGLLPAGPFMATYYATKAYVASLTRAVAEELRQRKSHVYIGCLCPGPVDTEFNSVANVEFALKGISAEYCANYAIDQMKKRKVVIVPTATMKFSTTGSRYVPQKTLIKIVAHQQKKKIYKN